MAAARATHIRLPRLDRGAYLCAAASEDRRPDSRRKHLEGMFGIFDIVSIGGLAQWRSAGRRIRRCWHSGSTWSSGLSTWCGSAIAELIMLGMQWHVFPLRDVSRAVRDRRADLHRRGRRAGRRPASRGDPAAPRHAADQSAARDGRRAVLSAKRRDGDVRDRLPQSRHSPAGARYRGYVHQLCAAAGVCRGAGGDGRALSCSSRAATPARRSGRSRRTGRSCR